MEGNMKGKERPSAERILKLINESKLMERIRQQYSREMKGIKTKRAV